MEKLQIIESFSCFHRTDSSICLTAGMASSQVDAQELEVQRVWMDGDAPDLAERYLEGDGDPSALCDWNPTAPGPGWFLLALYDEENDGPVAWFARRAHTAK